MRETKKNKQYLHEFLFFQYRLFAETSFIGNENKTRERVRETKKKICNQTNI